MNEKLLRFGPNNGLVGVLCEPAAPSVREETPALLLYNAGLLPRVGPFCWYVTLARRLAELGVISLRFDLSGLGDSESRPSNLSETERAVEDLRAAMDFLQSQRNLKRFVLIGLCSGAFQAHHAAVADERVAGVAFIDGYGYPTLGYRFRHYGSRLLRCRSWWNYFRRLLGKLSPNLASTKHPRAPAFEAYHLDFPPRQQVCQDLQLLLRRNLRMLFLYTGGLAPFYFNHRRQFREMFGPLIDSPLVEAEYVPQADHLFCDLTDRAWLLNRLEQWILPKAP